MIGEYTDEELHRLHEVLYETLTEIVRVCDLLNIPYFIQGGTAIGAFYEESILPWDDDIDLGMTRPNYERFLREAPALIDDSRFFLQWVETEPHTPFYFAKMRRKNTTFLEHDFRNLPIHQGIFIDIFPYDRVPDNPWMQRAQRTLANFFNCCFIGKEVWMWRHCGRCETDHHTNRGFLPCLLQRIVQTLLTKRMVYRLLRLSQGMANGLRSATFYNMVLMPRDHIAVHAVENPERRQLGPVSVWAPSDLETYLRRHYPGLQRYVPKEKQQNHRPDLLQFE